MGNVKERQSNLELMRIISMLFIIIYHICLHNNFNATGTLAYLLIFLESLILVHVNSFILLTGYFQCKSDFKASKVLSLINATWFWRVFYLILFLFLIPKTSLSNSHIISSVEIIETIFPLGVKDSYWFINCYLVLYIISPILNKIIKNSSKKELKTIIIVLLLIFSIITVFTRETVIFVNGGRSLITFIVLYFVGAYLRLYPLENSYLFKNYTTNAKKLIFIFFYIFFAFLSFSCIVISSSISFGTLSSMISETFSSLHTSYLSIIIIMQTIFYFLFFKTINLNSKFINKISKYTFGVYLVHENVFIKENLYNLILFSNYSVLGSKLIIIILICSIIIYIISIFLEMIRQSIFNFIYNFKISKIFRKKYRAFIDSLGIKINW